MRLLLLFLLLANLFAKAQTEVFNTVLGEVRLNLLDDANKYELEFQGNAIHELEFYSKGGDFGKGTYFWSYGPMRMTYTVVPAGGRYKIDYQEPESYSDFLEKANFLNADLYFKIHHYKLAGKVLSEHVVFTDKENLMRVMVTDQVALLTPRKLEIAGKSKLDDFKAEVRFDEDDFRDNREKSYPQPLDMVYDLKLDGLDNEFEIKMNFLTQDSIQVTLNHILKSVVYKGATVPLTSVSTTPRRIYFSVSNSELTLTYVSDALKAYDPNKVAKLVGQSRKFKEDEDDLVAVGRLAMDFVHDLLKDEVLSDLKAANDKVYLNFRTGEIE